MYLASKISLFDESLHEEISGMNWTIEHHRLQKPFNPLFYILPKGLYTVIQTVNRAPASYPHGDYYKTGIINSVDYESEAAWFLEFSLRFYVTTAGQMKEKWPWACRIPIYRAPSLVEACHVRMHLCGNACSPVVLFFSMRTPIPRPRACKTWIFSRLFPSAIVTPFNNALNTNLTSDPRARHTIRTCLKRDRIMRTTPLVCVSTNVARSHDRHTCTMW